MQLKWTLFNALSKAACKTGGLGLLQGLLRRRLSGSAVAVLTYHRIADATSRADLDPTLASAAPDAFASQLDYLGQHFTFVSADSVLAASRGERSLPANALLLTFDDAYDDFASAAWPELRARNIPAVLFVPTAYATNPDRRFWWDDLHYWLTSNANGTLNVPEVSATPLAANERATRKRIKAWLKSLDPATLDSWMASTVSEQPAATATLSWDALSELASQGVTLCPHSVTHPILTQLDDSAVHAEIEESYEHLKQRIPQIPPVFAYPSGYTNERVTAVCENTSMELAFTTRFGIASLHKDNHWQLNRISVSGSASQEALRSMILAAGLRR